MRAKRRVRRIALHQPGPLVLTGEAHASGAKSRSFRPRQRARGLQVEAAMSIAQEARAGLQLPARPARWSAWLALASAGLAWMFDAMDFLLFTLVLFPTISELIGSSNPGQVAAVGGIVVSCKILAWGVGGIIFGVLADRVGRARTMLVTVLIYALFTGLCSLAQSWWQLAALQALAGLGLGGEWAAGAALVSETWPERTRPRAVQVMQLCFGLGFFLAALVNLVVSPFGWRWVFVAGVVPAPVILLLRMFVQEPDRWRAARREWASDPKLNRLTGTFRAIFAPGIRRGTIIGVLLALSMLLGSNSVQPLSATWIHALLPPGQQALAGQVISHFYLLSSIGGIAGYACLMWPVERLPRRCAYTLVALGCAVVTLVMFLTVTSTREMLFFAPFYGFFTIGGFGFFAVYLPELFPTAIRATGQGFCWNMARSVAALGPLTTGMLVSALGSVPAAGRLIAFVYVLGLVAIRFGPETKGQPLQD